MGAALLAMAAVVMLRPFLIVFLLDVLKFNLYTAPPGRWRKLIAISTRKRVLKCKRVLKLQQRQRKPEG